MIRNSLILLLALTGLATAAHAEDRYVVVDGFYTQQGTLLSLDAESAFPQSLPDLTSDIVFFGVIQSGRSIEPFGVRINQGAAQKLELVSVAEGVFQVHLDGEPMETEYGKLEVRLEERLVPGTDDQVRRITGSSTDGQFQFSITDDPLPAVIPILVAGLGAACGIVYVVESWRKDCAAAAIEQCGAEKVKSSDEEALLGFEWKGGFKLGCGKGCRIECTQ